MVILFRVRDKAGSLTTKALMPGCYVDSAGNTDGMLALPYRDPAGCRRPSPERQPRSRGGPFRAPRLPRQPGQTNHGPFG